MVTATVESGVGLITLARPERRNALHVEMYDAVPDVLDQFADDDAVGCILITGAGSAFCAGGDVRDGKARRDSDAPLPSVEERTRILTHHARMARMLHESPKITMAALPGGAVGAGFSLALSTDLRVAAAQAKLIPGWGDLAFSGDFGGAWFLARLVGPSRALEILLSGAPIAAAHAHDLGLVNAVVEDVDLLAEATAWARRIAAGPRLAWGRMKQNIHDSDLSLEQYLPRESERMVLSGTTEEHKEAVRRWMAAARAKKAQVRGD